MRNDFKSGYSLAIREPNYLAHSAKGTTWTKEGHKWVERFKRAGRWVYVYPITGQGYKNREAQYRAKAGVFNRAANRSRYGTDEYKKNRQYEIENTYKANKAKRDYETKSLAGYIERGSRIIDKIFKSMSSEPTIRVETYTTGKKRK